MNEKDRKNMSQSELIALIKKLNKKSKPVKQKKVKPYKKKKTNNLEYLFDDNSATYEKQINLIL